MDSSSSSESRLATAKTILSTVGSLAATIVVIRGVTQDILPSEFTDYITSGISKVLTRFSNQLTLVVEEFDGLVTNEIYDASKVYLGSKVSPSTRRFKISKPEKEKHYNITMERDEEIVDFYNGEKFKWVWLCKPTESKSFYNPHGRMSTLKSEVRSFELTFHKRNRDLVIQSYLPHIVNEAKNKKQEKRTIKLFTLDYDATWTPVTLDHPSTFDTLAMDVDLKEMVLRDLDRFLKRREYYRKVGKAWKRGYLLYGPPGTGKSSLIAAMANYLNFDVYDLELTELTRNSELRSLLVETANKSILVVEDIDCTIELQEKLAKRDETQGGSHHGDESKVTLSGLLNFVDGLWSSMGDERIIIFTTNHIEKLDPALLRPGRMDVHINMSYCTPSSFRVLASNYLGIKDHIQLEEIDELIVKGKVTPAEVAEQLLKNDDPDVSLKGLTDFIHLKIKQNLEAEAEKAKAEELMTKKQENSLKEENIKETGKKEEETMNNSDKENGNLVVSSA